MQPMTSEEIESAADQLGSYWLDSRTKKLTYSLLCYAAALDYHVASEDGPCELDHHGGCQAHDPNEGETECHIRQHRRMLGLDDSV